MNLALRLYLPFFVFVYGLYTFFNRGVAYTFLAEASWLLGILLAILYRKELSIVWNKGMKLLLILFAINLVYIVRGIQSYPIIDVIRDSFMLQYAGFVFIIALLRPVHDQLLKSLYKIYLWFPWVVLCTLLFRTRFPEWNEFSLFGGVPLLVYKNGDLAVHLLISSFFLIEGKIQLSKRWVVIQVIVIAYLFLLMATFNRGGMLAFVLGFSAYLYTIRKTDFAQVLFRYLRLVPVLLMIAVPLYLSTKIKDDVQGRNTGLKQLSENVTSIVNRNMEGGLNDNVLWRLVWWGKIIDYTIMGPYILHGKGLGVNLSVDDEIAMNDDSLRSPHNFHLNILARFGLPITLIWLYFLFIQLKQFRNPNLSRSQLILLCTMLAFLINASFDVALEGPMAAMPFWIITGLFMDAQGKDERVEELANS